MQGRYAVWIDGQRATGNVPWHAAVNAAADFLRSGVSVTITCESQEGADLVDEGVRAAGSGPA